MNFNKAMIDLVQELRRRAPSELKPAIKLANPELFDELTTLYKKQSDTVTKALIKELFSIAGGNWVNQLEENTGPSQRLISQIYRGQIKHVEPPSSPTTPIAKTNPKTTQRIYRGQVVND